MISLYLVCFLLGLGLSVVSFVSGLERVNIFEHLFHGHHAGGHTLHHGGPAHHGAHHGHAHGHAAHAAHDAALARAAQGSQTSVVPVARVSRLNALSITAFITWFGGAGTALTHTVDWPAIATGGLSLGAGIVGSSIINALLRTFVRNEREAVPITWLGLVAKVTIPIRAGGTGEIVFTHDGTRQVAGARSEDDTPIGKGTEVVITRYDKGIAYVCTWEELPAATPES